MDSSDPDSSPPTPDNPEPFKAFEVHSSERIYDSAWCGLRRDMVILPGGKLQEYHVFEIENAVAVVPILRNGRVLLIGQYRYPHGKTHWEIPAGRLDQGEDAQQAGERELEEETGHRADSLIPMPGFYPTNGISAHYAHAFLALGCHEVGELKLDPAERIIVRSFSPAEVEALLKEGRIEDAFAALPLLQALHFHAHRFPSTETAP